MIKTFEIQTCMGAVRGNNPLDFLNRDEKEEFDSIGYSGKTKNKVKISREEYLNSLGKGEFKVQCTKRDNGDFCEQFFIIRVTPE